MYRPLCALCTGYFWTASVLFTVSWISSALLPFALHCDFAGTRPRGVPARRPHLAHAARGLGQSRRRTGCRGCMPDLANGQGSQELRAELAGGVCTARQMHACRHATSRFTAAGAADTPARYARTCRLTMICLHGRQLQMPAAAAVPRTDRGTQGARVSRAASTARQA